MHAGSPRIPRISIALLSCLVLSYEILLMRLFSIIQWHHFAYMIISLALLGFGISGTLLSLFSNVCLRRFNSVYISNIILFALTSIGGFLAAQQMQFNAEQILWDNSQAVRLFGIYVLLTLPFMFAANAIGLALMHFRQRIGEIYAADLVGAGAGCVLIIALLYFVLPVFSLQLLSSGAIVCAAVAWLELRMRNRMLIGIILTLSVLPMLLSAGLVQLNISPYKELQQLLRVDGTRIVDTRSSPLGLINIVESATVPIRYAPGLSISAEQEPPPQLALFTDGDSMMAITQRADNTDAFAYLDQMTSSAVYHLTQAKQLLILGAGTGNDVLQARYHNVPHIDAVELNPQIVELMKGKYAAYAGNLYNQSNINIHVADAREFTARAANRYDAIQFTALDSVGASSAGYHALNENYLYTVQAIKQYLSLLNANGYLSMTRWIHLPPRHTLKLLATAIDALRQLGVEHPHNRILLIRSWQTATLLIKNDDITADDITHLKSFCQDRAFDLAYYPGVLAREVNLYNILNEPLFYQAAIDLLGENRDRFMQHYKFNITPTTDDRPYFYNFFKRHLLPEVIALKDQGGMPLLEWGYLILTATLMQALIAGVVLIIAPLLVARRLHILEHVPRFSALTYFTALGLAFFFIEIAFMQKFILFLYHPVYAIAVSLATFLVFAGLGSAGSGFFIARYGHHGTVVRAVIMIAIIGISYSAALDTLFEYALQLPFMVKVVITVLLIAPLAFCMGLPFPVALDYLGKYAHSMIPWVWGINGCASVVSAVLATLLAVEFGFSVVIFFAVGLYILAAAVMLKMILRIKLHGAS